LRIVVIAAGKPVALNDVNLDTLVSQRCTERWMCLEAMAGAAETAPKIDYLRFRTVWTPSDLACVAAAADWDGDVLFLDGTCDSAATQMVK